MEVGTALLSCENGESQKAASEASPVNLEASALGAAEVIGGGQAEKAPLSLESKASIQEKELVDMTLLKQMRSKALA